MCSSSLLLFRPRAVFVFLVVASAAVTPRAAVADATLLTAPAHLRLPGTRARHRATTPTSRAGAAAAPAATPLRLERTLVTNEPSRVFRGGRRHTAPPRRAPVWSTAREREIRGDIGVGGSAGGSLLARVRAKLWRGPDVRMVILGAVVECCRLAYLAAAAGVCVHARTRSTGAAVLGSPVGGGRMRLALTFLAPVAL